MSLDIRINSIDAQISYLKILLNSNYAPYSKVYERLLELKEERHELLLIKIRRDKLIKLNG